MIDHGMINHIQRKMPSKEHIKLCRYVLERAQRNPTFIAIELCLDESCHAKHKKTCSKKELCVGMILYKPYWIKRGFYQSRYNFRLDCLEPQGHDNMYFQYYCPLIKWQSNVPLELCKLKSNFYIMQGQ